MLSNYGLLNFSKKTDFTVLIVDDQPTNIQLIYQLLKDDYQ
ncbi:diguanylate cyclase response regulator, partial [Vibrio anguillarum]|nr:diguanylate cyclase response regulator [Vibrio anguillarum]